MRKPDDERCDRQVHVCMDPETLRALDAAKEALGQKTSATVRQAVRELAERVRGRSANSA